MTGRRTTGIILLCVGVALLALGLGIGLGLPTYVYRQVDSKVYWPTSVDDSKYGDWLNNDDYDDVPMYNHVYMFNITNPTGFLKNQENPYIREIGPYIYRYIKRKIDVTWDATGEFVQFKEFGYQLFQPSLSPAGLNPKTDNVFQLNNVYLRALTLVRSSAVLSSVFNALFSNSTLPASCNALTPTTYLGSSACVAAIRALPLYTATIASTAADQTLFAFMVPIMAKAIFDFTNQTMRAVTQSNLIAKIPVTFGGAIVKSVQGTTIHSVAVTVLQGSSLPMFEVACDFSTTADECSEAMFSLNPTIDCATLPNIAPLCTGGDTTVSFALAAARAYLSATASLTVTWAQWSGMLGLATDPIGSDPNHILYNMTKVPPSYGVFRWMNPSQEASLATAFGVPAAQVAVTRNLLNTTLIALDEKFADGMGSFYVVAPLSNGGVFPTAVAQVTPVQLAMYQLGACGVMGTTVSFGLTPTFSSLVAQFAALGRPLPFASTVTNLELFSFAVRNFPRPSEYATQYPAVKGSLTISPLTLDQTTSVYTTLQSTQKFGSFFSAAADMRAQEAVIKPKVRAALSSILSTDMSNALKYGVYPAMASAAAFYFSNYKTTTGLVPSECSACNATNTCVASKYTPGNSAAACFEWAQAQSDFDDVAISSSSSPANANLTLINDIYSGCNAYLAVGIEQAINNSDFDRALCYQAIYDQLPGLVPSVQAVITSCNVDKFVVLERRIYAALYYGTDTVRNACGTALKDATIAAPALALNKALALAAGAFDFTLSNWRMSTLSTFENTKFNVDVIFGYVVATIFPMIAKYFDGSNRGLVVRRKVEDFTLGHFSDDFYVALTGGLLGPAPGFLANYTSEAEAHTYGSAYKYNTGVGNRGLIGSYAGRDGSASVLSTYYPSVAANRPELMKFRGSDGSQFHPAKKQLVLLNFAKPYADSYDVWVTQVSRAVPVLREDHFKVHGITVNLFRLKETLLQMSDPVNVDYGVPYDGLQPVSNEKGFLAYVSRPMFLYGDPRLAAIFAPTLPAANKELHDSYIAIEPITGTAMQSRKRLQGNQGIDTTYVTAPFSGTYMGYNMNATYINKPIPYYWVGEYGDITSSKASDFKRLIYGASRGAVAALVVGIVSGIVLCVIGAVLIATNKDTGSRRVAPSKVVPEEERHAPELEHVEMQTGTVASNAPVVETHAPPAEAPVQTAPSKSKTHAVHTNDEAEKPPSSRPASAGEEHSESAKGHAAAKGSGAAKGAHKTTKG